MPKVYPLLNDHGRAKNLDNQIIYLIGLGSVVMIAVGG